MRDLISDLLEGERLAAGSAALQREATDLNAWVQALVYAQFAGLDVTLTLEVAVPTLALDRTRLLLLVRNLLDNALRGGSGTPLARHTGLANGGVYLRLRVQGPGVAPAQLPHLTEAFYHPRRGPQPQRGRGRPGLAPVQVGGAVARGQAGLA